MVDRRSIAQDASMLMVDKIVSVYDEKEGASLPVLVGISQGGEKTLTVSPVVKKEFESLNLQKGDTVRVAVSSTTEYLEDISLLSHYDVAGGTEIAEVSDSYNGIKINSSNHKRWLFIGYVYERRGELLKIMYKGGGQYGLMPDAGELSGTGTAVYANPTASTTVTVYDRRNNRVFVGTFDDIKDCVHNGNEASRVIVRYDSGSLKEIMVYND